MDLRLSNAGLLEPVEFNIGETFKFVIDADEAAAIRGIFCGRIDSIVVKDNAIHIGTNLPSEIDYCVTIKGLIFYSGRWKLWVTYPEKLEETMERKRYFNGCLTIV